jgi:hypothetical protein
MRTVPIYPAAWAESCKELAGQKYRPSNGDEGEAFFAGWCCECAHDRAMREGAPLEECDDNERCDIIADTYAYPVDHPKYPAAWQYGPDGQPRCTAFAEPGNLVYRDEHTLDLFAKEA